MKILLTGGAGYVGTELVKLLNADENVEKIIIYDNLSRNNYNIFLHSGISRGKVQFVKGELLDSRKLRQVVSEVDTIYHLAARVTTPLSNESSHLFEQVNNWGTAELVYAAEESDVKRFIYTSSASIYGATEEEIDINTNPDPKSFYGISKLRGEQHVERLMKKMDTYIIRSANIYGCGTSLRFDAVINSFMFEACFNGRIRVHGDGSQRRSFIHVKKATSILNELKNHALMPGKYNLVDRVISIEEIAFTIKEIMPETEMVYINQHLKMRELRVKSDAEIMKLNRAPEKEFIDEMIDFRNCFYNSAI